jgi:DnaK suppressor protein
MDEHRDIRYFRHYLIRMRHEISSLQETRDLSTAPVKLDQSSVGRLSRMDALQQQAMAKSGQARAADTLRKIEVALRRCDDGSYGLCVDCDEPIASQRLEFDPTVLRCIQCEESNEA